MAPGKGESSSMLIGPNDEPTDRIAQPSGGSFRPIEEKWWKRWSEAKAYEPDPRPGRPKFFATFPYPYMNSFAHVGHAFTIMRNDVFCRFQRMLGKNVLFPFAYHLTGTPIAAAADRVRKSEEKQMTILREQGIPEEWISRFGEFRAWAEYFPREWKRDLVAGGFGIDWRREFVTTGLNPYYDAFVRWQFGKLKEKNFVQKGRHPIIWCPTDKQPVLDHDRAEGEGETPQEYVLLKFKISGEPAGSPSTGSSSKSAYRSGDLLVAATLRPETIFGQTNLWVRPDLEYARAEVDGEMWIVSQPCADKLVEQKAIKVLGHVKGSELVGKHAKALSIGRDLLVLPSKFPDPNKGTAVITSVPSDSPDDYVALRDLQESDEECRKHGLDPAAVKALKPIPIIHSEGFGDTAAKSVVERLGIHHQMERDKLDMAREEVYKASFYTGKMLPAAGEYAGLSVEEAKERVKAALLKAKTADLMYEPSGKVVCRCLTPAVVKIVADQWFMKYSDKAWKALAHECLDDMNLYPDLARKQFHIVIDWLNDWACTREYGLGTRLPWDERWLIESLSDSTIYMAYYTIAHILQKTEATADELTPALFDFVFLGEGSAKAVATKHLSAQKVEEMRTSFTYWYPLDFRNSGKDLLQNHLSFMVFNHCAVFPREHWPRGIGVNGWVMVDGEKMSKSKGNFIMLREALRDHGISETRLALVNAGEGLDDANFEADFARSSGRRLQKWLDELSAVKATRTTRESVDAWFESVLHKRLGEAKKAMGETMFRSALKVVFFDMQSDWAWYLRRSGSRPHRDLARAFAEAQAKAMAPFVPHLAEELWERLGRRGLVIDQGYPEADESKIRPEAEAAESYLSQAMGDVQEIIKITKMAPKAVLFFTSPGWKREALRVMRKATEEKGALPDPGTLIKACMADESLKAHAKELPRFAAQMHKSPETLRRSAGEPFDEFEVLHGATGFLEASLGAKIELYRADDARRRDPANKAGVANPGKPAIYLEA